MLSDTLEWCTLTDFTSGETLLKDGFGASGQLIKKFEFTKEWLAQRIAARSLVRLPIAFVNRSEIWPIYQGPAGRVLAETENFLALHKPPGIHTHPLNYEEAPNLVSWLVQSGRPEMGRVNQQGMDRGCLWRLDQDTSGLVLYAKNDPSYQHIRNNFAQTFRKKYYLAVVAGNPGEASEVSHFLVPSGPKGQKMKVGTTGQRALLSYQTLATVGDYSLVLIELKTGLRHQIRVQMASLGHPLLGDTFYGGAPAERMYLHCWRYETAEQKWEDPHAELFGDVFDLNGLLQVVHDKLG